MQIQNQMIAKRKMNRLHEATERLTQQTKLVINDKQLG